MTYELSGDSAWSLRDYAAEVSRQSGEDIAYQQVSAAEYQRMLLKSGLPEVMVPVFVETEDAIARGELATVTGDLSRLIGRPTTPLSAVISAELTS
jgi:NAD(P)H dehydrogenase (quinone)